MKAFLYEWSCSELFEPTPATSSLAREGKAMLECVAEDILDLGHSIGTISSHYILPQNDRIDQLISKPRGFADQFQMMAESCQYAIIIAPEIDNILVQRLEWLTETGCRNVGCSKDSVQLTGDKLALWLHWNNLCVPSIPTWANISEACEHSSYVIKPQIGAGSCHTRIILDPRQLESTWHRMQEEGCGPLVIQPKYEGNAISIAVLISPHGTDFTFLPACSQSITINNYHFNYNGGSCPLGIQYQSRAERLARQCLKGIDGLAGWVGIDLILGDATDGTRDVAVEINPRLTTSYIGIRRYVDQNLIGLWMNPMKRHPRYTLNDKINKVAWSQNGAVHLVCGDSI